MTIAPVVLPSLFWLGGAMRLPAACRSAVQRALCAALLCFAAGLTLHIPRVYVRVDHAIGVANVANLGQQISAILGASLLVDVSRAIAESGRQPRRAPRLSHALAGIAVLASVVLFALSTARAEAVDFGQVYGGEPLIAAYCLVAIAYFEICLVEFARLSFSYSRRISRRPMRVGLQLVGIGVSVGILYSASLVVELATELVSPESVVVRDVANVAHVLLTVGATAAGLGLVLPALAAAARRIERRVVAVRALCRLRPVWLTAIHAVPHVVLGDRPSRARDVFAARPQLRLLGRMVEVRDAMLALREYVSEEAAAAARAAGLQHAPGDRRAAAESSSWLRSAIEAKLAGAEPLVLPPSIAAPAHDVEDEYAFAQALATEWTTSSQVRLLPSSPGRSTPRSG